MRINIYAEEIDFDRPPTFERKHVEETGLVYYGIRFWMKRSEHLHQDPDDDDTTAVTFWTDLSDGQSRLLWSQFLHAAEYTKNGRDF